MVVVLDISASSSSIPPVVAMGKRECIAGVTAMRCGCEKVFTKDNFNLLRMREDAALGLLEFVWNIPWGGGGVGGSNTFIVALKVTEREDVEPSGTVVGISRGGRGRRGVKDPGVSRVEGVETPGAAGGMGVETLGAIILGVGLIPFPESGAAGVFSS